MPRKAPFNNPFHAKAGEIRKRLKKARKATLTERISADTPKKSVEEPQSELARAMQDVQPLHPDPRGLSGPKPPPTVDQLIFDDEDAEVVAELSRLVEGETIFDITATDEFIEGSVAGLPRRVLQRLKRGDFAFSAHLDLHGLTRDEARDRVQKFIVDSQRRQERCVLIVHGRGNNSKDGIPVLKTLLSSWLNRGSIGRNVLAFCTARPHDGGAGAMYVLIRK